MTLYIAGQPTNLTFAPGSKVEEVTSDLYGIMDRVAKNHPAINVVKIVDADGFSYVVSERDLEGTDHYMFRIPAIDGRFEERLDRIKSVPLERRIEEAVKIEEESKAHMEEEGREKLWEDFGDPLRRQLIKDGFGSGTVTTSYRKRGAKDRNRS